MAACSQLADTNELQWHTVEVTVPLLTGAQTIRIRCNGQTLHSIDFAVKSGVAMK